MCPDLLSHCNGAAEHKHRDANQRGLRGPASAQIKGICTLETGVSDDDGCAPGSLREPIALGDFRKRPEDFTFFPEVSQRFPRVSQSLQENPKEQTRVRIHQMVRRHGAFRPGRAGRSLRHYRQHLFRDADWTAMELHSYFRFCRKEPVFASILRFSNWLACPRTSNASDFFYWPHRDRVPFSCELLGYHYNINVDSLICIRFVAEAGPGTHPGRQCLFYLGRHIYVHLVIFRAHTCG